ncbi:bifunctional diaminohydroxyphosphoribosylaminopyrimidine deaminase/5-amino-6-(5-phosphoribosylamino)uracil reductase RibD [bacterium]|nr:MAG: bifunctional diaminohydroxyphosphoribosylaminopyrimidine deaminase/5-amino-6-(5-phosphoribosylamino)uracil reductase RibD [bacterium]
MTDAHWMAEAITTSNNGFPAPNPHVGCVLVKDGAVVGRGWCDFAGAPHAEAMALSEAGFQARGSTAYVTLEPCNHYGRTPPCSLALLAAGVARVVVACADLNPRAAGGAERLRSAGIPTEIGLMAEEAAAENRAFLFAVANKRPFVVAKAGASLDGRIALPSGESQWITSPASREEGHRLRADLGAVLVGRRTVQLDDPQLTARIPGVVNQPLRIVLDPLNRLTGREKIFDDSAPTRHVTGLIDLSELLASLYEAGHIGLLVEGGARTIASFFEDRLVDRVELFMGPKVLGAGPSWLEGLKIQKLAEAPSLKIDRVEKWGSDVHISASVSWV